MTLKELLEERGITTALILDDAFDAVPLAEDLIQEEEAWATFFDDLGSNRESVITAFPEFDQLTSEALQRSDSFVAALWGLKNELPTELWQPLFEGYEQGMQTDHEFLSRLQADLETLGLALRTAGRHASDGEDQCGIVFADLFLGAAQVDPDMARSLDRLRALLRGREADPPLVILMSRSDRLSDKKAFFRDSAGLSGTMFRVHSKRDLLDGSTLQRTLERLATHRPDAVRVTQLISAWENGLNGATERFIRMIRRLDLSDYVQIREVLLEFEGQPIGSYLLDVFDRVLQYEIEAHRQTISAAAALNEIDPKLYPTPYIAGSSDLQELVDHSIWQNPNRLAVKGTTSGSPVSFGDVLILRSIIEATPRQAAVTLPDALVVVTPSCDLVREGAKRAMFMAGKLAELTPRTWSYEGRALKTPILVLPNGQRMWIEWDVKDVQAISFAEIPDLISSTGSYMIYRRLREGYALELQQRLLADLGRVGVAAPMPATFPVAIEVATLDSEGKMRMLHVPVADRDGGVCYTGRDADSEENARLIFTEDLLDALRVVISQLDEASTYEKARGTLQALKGCDIAIELQRGITVPSRKTDWRPLQADVEKDGVVVRTKVGLVARNPTGDPTDAATKKLGALIIIVRDQDTLPGNQTAADNNARFVAG